MELPLYQIDAFTDHLFSGNPACVVPLTKMLPDALLLKIAQENAVAETAFFLIKDKSNILETALWVLGKYIAFSYLPVATIVSNDRPTK